MTTRTGARYFREPNESSINESSAAETEAPGTLVIVTAHGDDHRFAAGSIGRRIAAGWRAILVRTTNDELGATGVRQGEAVLRNARETDEAAKVLGIDEVHHFHYRQSRLHDGNLQDLILRLTLLLRCRRPTAAWAPDPTSTLVDEDQRVTGRAVVEACRHLANDLFYPEQLALAGARTHRVDEQFHFLSDRATLELDVESERETKVASLAKHVTLLAHRTGRKVLSPSEARRSATALLEHDSRDGALFESFREVRAVEARAVEALAVEDEADGIR